jgi:hypothetical protein
MEVTVYLLVDELSANGVHAYVGLYLFKGYGEVFEA